MGYGPHFMMSQNIATMDEPPYLTDATRTRLTPTQLDLFRPYAAHLIESIGMRGRVRRSARHHRRCDPWFMSSACVDCTSAGRGCKCAAAG